MSGTKKATPSNRLGLDYRAGFAPPPVPIIDAHAHINGARAAAIYAEARRLYGVERVFSQTQLAQAEAVRDVLGETIHFVAIPEYMSPDPKHAHTEGFLENIARWHELGARMVKFWCAPRGRDFGKEFGDPTIMTLDNPWRRRQMDRAAELGMVFMMHVADPDTWFASKYTDSSFYGTKREQYEQLERAADDYPDVPWLLAHMGGSPEDLVFLDGLLTRYPQFVLDTSATKWMVRELSRQPREELLAFLMKFRGRVLFGSDIVTMDAHMSDDAGPRNMGAQASTEDEAFDLYASRYWALRTMLETDYDGESPIADPDLAMVEPEKYDAMSAPRLVGKGLPREVLVDLYRGAAMGSVMGWYGVGGSDAGG